MKNKNTILYVIIGILVVGVIAAFFFEQCPKQIDPNIPNLPNPNTTGTTEQIQFYKNSDFVILSKDDLLNLLKQSSTTSSTSSRGGLTTGAVSESVAGAPAMDNSAAPKASESGDYSTTNVQVSGIDEGDIVKTNGDKIFIAKQNKLIVVNNVNPPLTDIYDLEISKEVTNYTYFTSPAETIQTMLIDNDLLYLVTIKYRTESKFESSLLYPQILNIPITVVSTYQIGNDNLTKLNSIEIDGQYYESRFKDGYVYLITNVSDFYYPMPLTTEDLIINPIKEIKAGVDNYTERTIIMPKDGTPDNKNMYTITSIKYDETNDSVIDSVDLLLDYSSTVYMSNDNLYIAHKENTYYGPWFFYRGFYNNDIEVFKAIYKDVYPSDIQSDIENNIDDQEKLQTILNDYYNTLDANEKEQLYNRIQDAADNYYQEKQQEREKTFIDKIELKQNGKLGAVTNGFVQGNLLNQFALDEDSDGYLRVAITYTDADFKNANGIVVLDSELQEYSKLDGLATGESIYSVRFLGDKVFLVTYKQIDPFFVIDLSNRENPEVLGYLKIPGYSSYLHPISDTLILGIGQDTKVTQWGGTINSGVKVSLFDVSDYSNPEEIANYQITTDQSYTPVQYDHKAFLYIEKNNLIVLPVNEYFNTRGNETNFYVLEIKDNSIIKKEIISHNEQYANILRSLYIGEELYTISDNQIVTYNFNTEDTTEVTIDTPTPQYIGYDAVGSPVVGK